jgi:predicted nucleic acid-binding protein
LIVALDATVLIYLFTPHASPPNDPATGKPVERCEARVRHLLSSLQNQNAKIIIPTPALAEVLVRAEKAAPEYLRELGGSRHFRLVSFDVRAAIEFAATQARRQSAGARSPQPRAKAKFDDQIIAIAAIERATTIYSDDGDLGRLAEGRFDVVGISELALPPEAAQRSLPLDEPHQ